MEDVVSKSESLRFKFVELMNRDTESFNTFMAAMKMPKVQKRSVSAKNPWASKLATEVPLLTLEACRNDWLAYLAAKNGNTNTISDAGSAALLGRSGRKSCSLQCKDKSSRRN